VIKTLPVKERVKVVALHPLYSKLAIISNLMRKKIRQLEFNRFKKMISIHKRFNQIVLGESVPTQEELLDLEGQEKVV
jgi:hypothetical protein